MWAPGRPPGPAGWDRRRVGARLSAALAGLRELQGLRARQEAAVRGALAPRPPPGPRPPRAPEALEEALEEALAALQEQLHRLQHQDLSLRAHLAHLDQRVSELQLDVHSTPPDGPDSDSRPSSGFYEMSDGGSCSLSASCTSVCSDRPPCPRGPLLPRAPSARASAGAGRPWSADETTVCRAPLPVRGLQATEDGAGPSRPRPVSTGDLERVLPAEAGPPAADGATSSVLLRRGLGPLPPVLDPKYQRDLVSKGGGEVYLYPSPLHAVALQSPLFALPPGTPQRDSPPQPPSQSLPGHAAPRPARTWPAPDPGAAQAYIDKLLGLRGRGGPPRGHVGEQGPPSRRAETERRPEGLTCSPRGAGVGGGAPRGDTGGNSLEQRGPVPLGSPPPPSSLPEGGRRPPRSCVHAGTAPGSPPPGGAPRAQRAAPRGHPHSVAGSAAPTGPPTGQSPGPPATKAMRVGRGTSRAPPLPPTWGAGLGRRPPQAREAPGRSCSERSLFPAAPAPAPRQGAPAAAGRAARPRQRRWRSSVELSARARLPVAPGGGRDGGGRPAWPGASPPQPPGSPPGARPALSPVPGLRRTKASKALKKKICRFQPSALRVMTLV